MKKFYYRIPFILQNLFFVFFLPLHKIFVKFEVRGAENLENLRGPLIIASNHTGELDPTAIPLIFPFLSPLLPVYSVNYSSSVYKTSNFGWRRYIYGEFLFNLLGGYPIFSGYKNYAISLKNHLAILKEGRTLCIFPEGKITLDGKIGEAHGGLGYLVYATGATVLPIAIDTFYNSSWKKYFGFKQRVVITICKPMHKKEIITMPKPSVADFRIASQKVLDRIKEKLN